MNEGERLLARMRATKSGWGADDFEKLYLSFGFRYTENKGHRRYAHPKYPDLYAFVGRHRNLAKGYASDAVKLIDRLKEREGEDELNSK